MKKLLILLIALGFFFGCGSEIKEGEVYAKAYEEERTWVMLMPMTISNGKTTTTTFIPMLMHDDEDYIIKIRAFNEDKEKWEKRTFYVTKEVYKSTSEGDWFLFDKNYAETQDRHVKRRATQKEKDYYGVQTNKD
jgi:hypothetical protein